MKLRSLAAAALLCFGLYAPAQAQTVVNASCSPAATYPTGARGVPFGIDANGAICINGSISASLAGFAPVTTGTPISVTTSSVTGTLPAGAVVVATNVGTTNGAYCKLGASATTSDQYIAPNGGWFAFTVGANTQLTCITSTSTTTVNMVGGSGLPTGTGGGGGGSSGSVTQGTSPWVVAGTAATGAALSGNPVRIGMSDGTNTQNWLAALALGDGVNGNNTGAVAGWVWNGTTWDRMPGTAAGGVKVNVSNTNANGQATMANSSPVVIASNQASFPVAATLGAETTKNIGTVSQLPYPSGAVPYTATATGTTGATTATLAGAASVTTYICGFSIRANATAAATGNATVTGVITATLNFTQWTAPNASGLGITEMIFAPCIPASGTNQSVAVVSAAPGTGGVVSVTAWGYKL